MTYYAYPSKDAGAGPSDVWEFYGKLKPTLGPVGLTFGPVLLARSGFARRW